MTIAADSYLAMILPEDISKRIAEFITGQTNFPIIGENELMCIFCLYGKNKKVNGNKQGGKRGALLPFSQLVACPPPQLE